MRHEKIFKLDDGRIKVVVSFSTYHNKADWDFHVLTCAKGKRTWVGFDRDDYEFRRLSMDDRSLEVKRWGLLVAGEEKINETMLELYEILRPSFSMFDIS